MSGLRGLLVLAGFLSLTVPPLRAEPPPVQPARTDRYGDPLPPEALVRIGTVRLWHRQPVSSVTFTPDGKTAIAGCDALGSSAERDLIRFWDAATGTLLRSLDLPNGTECLALSSDGKILAAQS